MIEKLIVQATELNVRSAPSMDGVILGAVHRGDIVDGLETSGNWRRIQVGALTGWSYASYLKHYDATVPATPLDPILEMAAGSEAVRYDWKHRGKAPIGYIKGMALVYAREYCRLKAGNPIAMEMAKRNSGNENKDALAWYAQVFESVGMDNGTDGIDTLRHLFVLLIGLGMMESAGRHYVGRDLSANNTTAETAEAGLFQTSYNARHAHPLLSESFTRYSSNPSSGFLEVFTQDTPAHDSKDFGTGRGREFQRLSKNCPAFAAEFAALGLRVVRKHWGPISRRKVEVRPECDEMLMQVQAVVDRKSVV